METNRKHGRIDAGSLPRAHALGSAPVALLERFGSPRLSREDDDGEAPASATLLEGDRHDGRAFPVEPASVRCGELEIERARRRATVGGTPLRLTEREHAVLLYMAERSNRMVLRSDLLANIWTLRDAHGSNVVNAYVRRLRRKLGAQAGMIETIRGFGYILRPALGS